MESLVTDTIDINNTLNVKGDAVIGEDANDYLVVNSETRFLNDVNIGGSSIKLRSTDDTNANNFIEIMGERLHSTHVKTIRSINNNKIEGDLTIGEDTTDSFVVNSNAVFTGTLTANGGLVGGGGGGGSSGIKILANETITEPTDEIDLTISDDLESYEFFSLEISNLTADENGYIIFQTFTETGGNLDTNNINSKWETSNITDSDSSLITSKTLQSNHLLGFYTKGLQHFESKIYSLNKASSKIFSTFKTIGIHTNSGNETFSQTGNTTSNGTTVVCNKIKIKNLKLDESTFGQITAGTFILYGHAKVATSSITTTDLPTPTTNSRGKTLQVNSSGNGYVFSNGASLDGSIILGSQTAASSSYIELDAGASYSDYEYFTIIGIDIVCSNNGYIAWKGVKASDDSVLSTTTNNKWQVTNLTDSDEEGTFHTQQDFHVLGYHTKGSQNIKVKIFGLHNGGGTQKKYSMFKNIGTHQIGGTETNYQEGTSSQNKNDNGDNCRKIRIYNYDLTGSAGTITSGKFILYGHREAAITNNTIIPLPSSTNAGQIMKVNNTGTAYTFADHNIVTINFSEGDNNAFKIPLVAHDAGDTIDTLYYPATDGLRVNASNGNVSIGSTQANSPHKLFVNGDTKLGNTPSDTTTITKANITDATITDATIINFTVNGGSPGQILSKSSSGKLEYSNLVQKSIDFTAFTETAIRTTNTTDWWEVFGPTSSALAVCSGIIPQSLTSKMHIMVVVHLSGHDTDPYFQGILYRNVHVGTNSSSLRSSTEIGINTDTTDTPNAAKVSFTQKADYRQASLHQENISFSFVDDLTSSGIQSGDKVTYSVKVRNRGADTGQNTIRINRYGAINNHNYSTSVSTLTVVEY